MEVEDGAPVIGIVGAVGGIGASVFAAVVAAVAGGVLVDLDPTGALDALLGVESAAGVRWSGLRLDGGRLEPAELRAALPRWGPVALLIADGVPTAPDVAQVVRVARTRSPVVLDLGRGGAPGQISAAGLCDLVVLVAAADLPAVLAARRTAQGPALAGAAGSAGVVVRSPGESAARRAADAIGLPRLGRLPPRGIRRRTPHLPSALPRAERIVARGLLDAVSR